MNPGDVEYLDRMHGRIEAMVSRVENHLDTTEALFSATGQLRDDLIAQAEDAHTLAGLLEDGTEQDEALAQQLMDYHEALESALDIHYPAPHYQGTVSGLDQRLDPDQMETVMASPAVQDCADASLESALYSGHELLETGDSNNHPAHYRQSKRGWDRQCSAGGSDEYLYGYTAMAPVKEQVREVLSDQQIIEHDQRQIDAAMISHLPSAQRLGLDPMQRHAAHHYGAPMLNEPTPTTDHHAEYAAAQTLHFELNKHTGPDLGL